MYFHNEAPTSNEVVPGLSLGHNLCVSSASSNIWCNHANMSRMIETVSAMHERVNVF